MGVKVRGRWGQCSRDKGNMRGRWGQGVGDKVGVMCDGVKVRGDVGQVKGRWGRG